MVCYATLCCVACADIPQGQTRMHGYLWSDALLTSDVLSTLHMNEFKIKELGDPVDGEDAVNSRTLSAAISNMLSVIAAYSYGNVIIVAKSNGDYDNIQAAVDACTADDTILVFPGTYNTTDTVTFSGTVKIVGLGEPTDTIIVYDGGDSRAVITCVEGSDIYISNIALVGYHLNPIAVAGGGLTMRNSTVTRITESGGSVYLTNCLVRSGISISSSAEHNTTAFINSSFISNLYLSDAPIKISRTLPSLESMEIRFEYSYITGDSTYGCVDVQAVGTTGYSIKFNYCNFTAGCAAAEGYILENNSGIYYGTIKLVSCSGKINEVLGGVVFDNYNAINVTTNSLVADEIATSGTVRFTEPVYDETSSGITVSVIAGEPLLFGEVVRVAADGKYWKAKGDSATSMPATGICVSHSAGANNFVRIMLSGYACNNDWGTLTPGSLLWVSYDIAGLATQTQPAVDAAQVQCIGFVVDSHTIMFNPSLVVVEIKQGN